MAGSDTKAIATGLVLIATLLIGGFSYSVYETGNKIACRTNKPVGWEITANHNDQWYESVCNYKTKPPVYANCSSFKATASYSHYYCNEVKVIKETIVPPSNSTPPPPLGGGIKKWQCNNSGCVRI